MTDKKISIAEIVYLAYFAVMFGARAAGLYESLMLYNISLVLGAGLFALKIVVTKHTLFEYLIMLILIGMSLLVYYNTGEKGLLLYMTMILGMKGVSLARVEKWALTILGICFPTLVFLSVTGIIQDIAYSADGRAFFGSVMRRSLGYPYFNTMFTTYIVMVVLVMLCAGYQDRKTLILSSIFFEVIGVYLYIYSCSNTGIIVLTFYLAVNFFFQLMRGIGKGLGVLLQLVYPLGMLISIGAPLLINGSMFSLFDKIFHNRFNYANYYLTNEPVTLFGVRFGPTPNSNYIIDSSFLYSFLQLGVIPCILLTAMMLIMISYMVRNNRRLELAVIVAFCLLGMSDPFFYNLYYKNLMMLFVGSLFYNNWLPSIETKLPDVCRREFCVISIGSKEIGYGDNKIYLYWTKIGAFLKNVFNSKGLKHIVIFLTVTLVIFVAAYNLSDPAAVTGRVDEKSEWEYVRATMSFGVWVAIAVTLITTKFDDIRNSKGIEQ